MLCNFYYSFGKLYFDVIKKVNINLVLFLVN